MQEKRKRYRRGLFISDSFQSFVKCGREWKGIEKIGTLSHLKSSTNDLRVLEDFPPNLRVQLVITSPPYPNAFDYFLYHRHRMFWLGYDPIAVSKKEIGSHLNYQRKGTTEQNIASFKDAMHLCFHRINKVLEIYRFCCLVIGDSIFQKTTCGK